MSLRRNLKRKRYGVYFFEKEDLIGASTTQKITGGSIEIGRKVQFLTEEGETVSAKILFLTSK